MNSKILLACAHPMGWVAMSLLHMAGCATRRYHPAPISSATEAAAVEGRSLSDPGLLGFLQQHLSTVPKTWDPAALTPKAAFWLPVLLNGFVLPGNRLGHEKAMSLESL